MLPLIFLMPIIQLLILANAADYEVKNILLHVVDRDMSSASKRLTGKFHASTNFEIVNSSFSVNEGMNDILSDRADLIIDIPNGFEKDLYREYQTSIQLLVNSINGSKAGLAYSYSASIIQDFNQEIQVDLRQIPESEISSHGMDITWANWFNPRLNYTTFMVPGILVMLITLVGMFLCSMNIVKEKEIGTIEQLNVTPIKKYHFIIGKLLPFWIIAMVELVLGLVVAKWVFQITFVGSILDVFAFASLYLLVVLGIGLLVSTITQTQQQAMFISWFFLMIFILLSGLFTPIESMPEWAQSLTKVNPIAYFVDVMRMIILKGSTMFNIRFYIVIMLGYALVINGLAVLNYSKTGS